MVVDFTTPDAAPDNIRAAIDAGTHIVVGTSSIPHDEMREAASGGEANVLVVPNFAIGAVLAMRFAAEASKHMPEVEIIELHHDKKLDAPSGTAARTRDMIAEAGGNVHEPIHSIRLPGLVAHQEVVLGGEGQTLSIRHDSIDRTSFMPGVLLAVRGVGSLPDRYTIGLEAVLDGSIARMDATAQAELVRSGEASPSELVDAAIERVETAQSRAERRHPRSLGRGARGGAGTASRRPVQGRPFPSQGHRRRPRRPALPSGYAGAQGRGLPRADGLVPGPALP